MAKPNQQGFTLIEVVLVIAITGALLNIAFAGQGQLRAQAHFDAAINKIVSTVNGARNTATSGVDVTGDGKGLVACPGAPASTENVFAGTVWVANDISKIRMDYYRAVPQSSDPREACVFQSDTISMPADITVRSSINGAGSVPGAAELFVRSGDLLYVCPASFTATAAINTAFRSGSCSEGQLTLLISDPDVRRAVVEVDKSGLAQRKS